MPLALGAQTSRGLPRWFNFLAAALGLSLLAPLLGLVWLLVRLDSPGPGLFLQLRTGFGGRQFVCYKFRTMLAGPDDAVPQISDFARYVFNPAGGDRARRLTGLGCALRRTSIDELPQLLNVLRGEMALVGPRPELPEIVAQYPPEFRQRHAVPPGISGLAQINGRSDLTYLRALTYDRIYIQRRSQRLDVAIVMRTLSAVLRGSGAR